VGYAARLVPRVAQAGCQAVHIRQARRLQDACAKWKQVHLMTRSAALPLEWQPLQEDFPGSIPFVGQGNHFLSRSYSLQDCQLAATQPVLATPLSEMMQVGEDILLEAQKMQMQIAQHKTQQQTQRWNQQRQQEHRQEIEQLNQQAHQAELVPLEQRHGFEWLDAGLKKYTRAQYNQWVQFQPKLQAYYGGSIPGPILWESEEEAEYKMWLYHAHWKALLWSILEAEKGNKISFNRLVQRLNQTRPASYARGKRFTWSLEAITSYMILLEHMGYIKLEQEFFWPRMDFKKLLISPLHSPNEIPGPEALDDGTVQELMDQMMEDSLTEL